MREAMHLEYTMTERMSDVLKILRKQGWACYHLSQGGSLSLFLSPREWWCSSFLYLLLLQHLYPGEQWFWSWIWVFFQIIFSTQSYSQDPKKGCILLFHHQENFSQRWREQLSPCCSELWPRLRVDWWSRGHQQVLHVPQGGVNQHFLGWLILMISRYHLWFLWIRTRILISIPLDQDQAYSACFPDGGGGSPDWSCDPVTSWSKPKEHKNLKQLQSSQSNCNFRPPGKPQLLLGLLWLLLLPGLHNWNPGCYLLLNVQL